MKRFFILLTFIISSQIINAQVGIGTTTPDDSSILEIESTEKGVLIPRVTTAQRNAINSPENSLMVYNTTTNNYEYNSGTKIFPNWVNITYHPTIKYSNIDTATNINNNSAITLPVCGSLEWNDDASLYQVSGNTITINTSGKYRITTNISYNVPSVPGNNSEQRVSVEAQVAINGTPQGAIAASGYVRSANGHTDASLHLNEVLNLTAGDVISIQVVRSGNSAPAYMRSTRTSNIFIEKVN